MQASGAPANVSSLPTDTDDWADLDLGSPESQMAPHSHIETRLNMVRVDVEDTIPDISTIQRPEELMRRPPYWLVVRQEGRMNVTVQGSHAPSMACLDEYLRRWCRGDTSRVNRVRISFTTSHESGSLQRVIANNWNSLQLWRSSCKSLFLD